MSRISYLKSLHELERIAQGKGKNGIDKSKLEEDFLRFSAYNQEKKLQVRFPNLYFLDGEEKKHVIEALQAINPEQAADKFDKLEAIGISGDCEIALNQPDKEYIIIASLQQIRADHYSVRRSYLNPLLQMLYQEGANIIQNFSLHEVLLSQVKAKRGALDLSEAHWFPERFVPGSYRLEVELDTPSRSIELFRKLHQNLNQISAEPKKNLLDPKKIHEIIELGVRLRRKIGSLSRYEVPKEQKFSAETNSCFLEDEKSTLFYLYQPETKKNVLVHFGESPFEMGKEPKALTVLQGAAYEHSLAELVKFNFCSPSPAVLESRIADLTTLYEQALRSGQEKQDQLLYLQRLIGELQEVQQNLAAIANPAVRTEYALRLPHELLEFIVYPSTEDPVIHDLFSKLSWNRAIRDYHRTKEFKQKYSEADEAQKAKLLQEVKSNLIFRTQQNEEINLWLYQNHRDFCQEQGIEFDVVGDKTDKDKADEEVDIEIDFSEFETENQ